MIESSEGRLSLIFNRADVPSSPLKYEPTSAQLTQADVYLDSALKGADVWPLIAAAVQVSENKNRGGGGGGGERMKRVSEGVMILSDSK